MRVWSGRVPDSQEYHARCPRHIELGMARSDIYNTTGDHVGISLPNAGKANNGNLEFMTNNMGGWPNGKALDFGSRDCR